MKKFALGILAIVLGIGSSWAYEPTTWDNQNLTLLKSTLAKSENQNLWSYYLQFQKFWEIIDGVDERLGYLFANLRDYSYTQFANRKNVAKQTSKTDRQEFFDKYKEDLLLNSELDENCIWWYNSIDNWSYAYNFPTALTVAVWWRESSCGYYLPKNGDGPFQIISKDYGTGEITKEIFYQAIEDFLVFAHNKIDRYNRNNDETRQITLSYTGATYEDLIKFAALYNWLDNGTVVGDVMPKSLKYFFEGYKSELWTGESKKNGIFAQYLKVLDWENKM